MVLQSDFSLMFMITAVQIIIRKKSDFSWRALICKLISDHFTKPIVTHFESMNWIQTRFSSKIKGVGLETSSLPIMLFPRASGSHELHIK